MNRIVLVAATFLAVIPARAQQWQQDSLKGQSSGICEKKTVVIRSEREWGELWKQHAGIAASTPKVDFKREMIVAVFLGEKPKGGYSVEITAQPDPLDKNRLLVFYAEVPPQAFAAPFVSRPFAMLKVKIHASVAFEVNQGLGVLPGEEREAAPRRISPEQELHMYNTLGRLKAFGGSFDGLYRP